MSVSIDARILMGMGLIVVVGCSTIGKVDMKPGQQVSATLEKKVTVDVRSDYLLFLPKDYAKGRKRWPLILFLHGAGERGSDIESVRIHGVPKILADQPDFPFIVVSPQCPADEWWSTTVLEALLDEVEKLYRVDKDRIYVTGLSMGGYGTWNLALASPDRFAAIAPICGGGKPALAKRLRRLPIWVFHGAKDEVVPISESQAMVEALKQCGGNVEFTVYPEANHDSWTETYNNPKLYQWFLSHRKGSDQDD